MVQLHTTHSSCQLDSTCMLLGALLGCSMDVDTSTNGCAQATAQLMIGTCLVVLSAAGPD